MENVQYVCRLVCLLCCILYPEYYEYLCFIKSYDKCTLTGTSHLTSMQNVGIYDGIG